MTDLTWVLSSCVLIGTVIAIRAGFGKRMRPGLRYALWALVLLRLLYPGTVLSSPVSVQGVAEQTEVVQNFEAVCDVNSIEHMANGSVEGFNRYALMPERTVTVAEQVTPERFARMETAIRARDVLEPIWIIGIVVTAIAFLISNLRFYHTLRKRRKPMDADCPLRVYSVENLASSCLFGNAIYVAAETAADETQLRHVLAHELSHHRHGDHVWTFLRCVALSLHWYNPLIWWAAALSRQDSELCADAGALKQLGEAERENYGTTLIELSAHRAPKASLLCAATAMTNGKRSLKERVTMIARRPRMSAAVAIAVVAIAVVAAGCAFAGASAAPMTEKEALDALEASVTLRSDDPGESYVAFMLPEAYGRAEDWDIRVVGRAVYPDGMSRSVHEYELLPDVSDWEVGREYAIRADNLTELTFQVALVGQKGGLYEREFDVFLPEFVIEEDANTSQSAIWDADLNGDGTAERIVADVSALIPGGAASIWVEDANGNKLCDLGDIGLAHTGWRTLALTEQNGRTYLLEYSPTVFQGEAAYSYALMELQGGQLTEVELQRVAFSENPGQSAENNTEAMRRFQEKANDVWARSRLLITTDQTVLANLRDANGAAVNDGDMGYYIATIEKIVYYRETMMKDGGGTAETIGGMAFFNILGFDGYYTEDEGAPHHLLRRYLIDAGSGTIQIAESFGFDLDDYAVDLNGDGVIELVCNCVYGADGAQRAYVYRRNGDVIERGSIDYGKVNLTAWDNWSVNSTAERYDPASGKIVVEYASLASSSGDGSTPGTFIREVGYEDLAWEEYTKIAG